MPPTSTSGPLHLAVIPDGNRRWAREHQFKSVWKGHERAIENFRTLTDWCRKNPRIAVFTVWCFSTENWKRDPKEVAKLMGMLEDYLRKEQKGFLKRQTRFVHSGRRDRIPASLAKLIGETEELTKDQTAFTLHLAVDYGGKDEILRAMERVRSAAKLPTDIRPFLDHPELPDIDVILRSSGEMRTSNFFLWQTCYAEWVFSPKFFPDIDVTDLEATVREFDRRKRRFGS
jgi:undecaprenyl diphosphate synthase